MFSAPELLVHSPSFPIRGGNNKHAEMWHLGTATRFLLGIYKLENNQNTLPMPLSHGLQHRMPRCLWNHSWPLCDQDLHLGWMWTLHFQTCQMQGGGGLVPSEIQRWGETWDRESGIEEIHITQIWKAEPHLLRATQVSPLRVPGSLFPALQLIQLGWVRPQDGAYRGWLGMVRFTPYVKDSQSSSHLEEESAANFRGQSHSFLAHFFLLPGSRAIKV